MFEGEEYYTGIGSKINNFNMDNITAQMTKLDITTEQLGNDYLTKLVFPDEFYGNSVAIVDINNDKAFKSNIYFQNCGYLSFPSTMTTTNDANDYNKQIRCIDFGKNSQLTEIPYAFMYNASKLIRLLNMPKNLTKISENAFRNCYSLEGDENKQLYIGAKAIYKKAFDNAMENVESIVFGENVESMSSESFSNGERPNPKVKYIEFKCDVTKVSFPNCDSGSNVGAFYFGKNSSQRKPYSSLTCIILSNSAQSGCDGKAFKTVSGQNVYFNDTDGEDDLVYTAHTFDATNATILYNSFLENGSLSSSCIRCEKQELSSTPALFKYEGISAPLDGEIKITIGFTVNLKAIKQYEMISGNTIKFGAVVALEQFLGTNVAPLNDDASAKSKVVKASIDIDVVAYNFIITGFTEEFHKSLKILLSSYVEVYNSNNELTQIFYLQDKQVENNNFVYVSYNDYKVNNS